ncbi:MAG: filamentous hemagglutinin N-terminal domain-containing protein, partial [Hyphomicrobiales bacterium]|nr:filamentous hemagglutinin N-terminal domain-containing protein [Hyphomicrobiales bacterium]
MAMEHGASAQSVLPSGGTVAAGAASISQSRTAMTVNQTSGRAVVNWNSFSIGQGNSVTFNQPSASSAILNRVTGSSSSTIAGQLDANGQVYLVNPNGIAITRSGAVRADGGFVASTLAISDQDFLNGNLAFGGNGVAAPVDVAGAVRAGAGGFVGLIGGSVSVSGDVSVPLGKVGLGSGERATLDLTGDKFLRVAAPTGAKTTDGKALVDVSGKVNAAGGLVVLKAATVADAVRQAINIPGELSASSVRARGGAIVFSGGPGGDVNVSGRVSSSGSKKGGSIKITGRSVTLDHAKVSAASSVGMGGLITVTGPGAVTLAASKITTNGATRGGAIRVGGDFHGAPDILAARSVTIDENSTLNANAGAAGDGGSIAVWSNALTNFSGLITALGGANRGNGGSVEVSANPADHGVLEYAGFADLRARRGSAGTLLLDPYNITISTGPDSGGAFTGGVFVPASTSYINSATLENQLQAA